MDDYATDAEVAAEQGWDNPDPSTEARYTLEDEAREVAPVLVVQYCATYDPASRTCECQS